MKQLIVIFAVLSLAYAGDMICDVVSIETWANASSGYVEDLVLPINLVVVTHTVTPGCTTDDACERLSRSIRNAHIQQGFDDLRLSFLVGGNGKIYEGAGWHVGSHSTGYNNRSVSLSFIGDFTDTIPTDAALKAAQDFFGCFLNNWYLGCEYYVVGHRQIISSTSPGIALQSLIETWPHWTDDVSDL